MLFLTVKQKPTLKHKGCMCMNIKRINNLTKINFSKAQKDNTDLF